MTEKGVWVRWRFSKHTRTDWNWMFFPDVPVGDGSNAHPSIKGAMKEMCEDEAQHYERGARILWEVANPPRDEVFRQMKAAGDRMMRECRNSHVLFQQWKNWRPG